MLFDCQDNEACKNKLTIKSLCDLLRSATQRIHYICHSSYNNGNYDAHVNTAILHFIYYMFLYFFNLAILEPPKVNLFFTGTSITIHLTHVVEHLSSIYDELRYEIKISGRGIFTTEVSQE